MKGILEVIACVLFSAACRFLWGDLAHTETIGAALYFLLRAYWNHSVQPGQNALAEIPPERIRLNLEVSGQTPPKNIGAFSFPFWRKAALLVAIGAGVFVVGWAPLLRKGMTELRSALKPTLITLKVTYPSYQSKKPTFLTVPFGTKQVEAPSLLLEGNALLELGLSDARKEVFVEFSSANETAKAPEGSERKLTFERSLVFNREAVLNALSRPDQAGQPGGQAGQPAQPAQPGQDTVLMQFRSPGKEPFGQTTLVLKSIDAPVVTLSQANAVGSGTDAETPAGSVLNFRTEAKGSVPLSQVELQARTKSGYRFTRSIGEFANTDQTEFENQNVVLPLVGVPFAPGDSLFVKAVAKTVIPNLEGESQEIEFKIKTRQDIRKEIVERLTASKELLNKMDPKDLDTQKQELLQNLEAVSQLAPQLGQRHPLVKRAPEALRKSREIAAKGDAAWKEAKRRIDAALDTLKREQQNENTPQLMARIQNYKQSLEKPGSPSQELQKLGTDLSKDVESAKKELGQMAESGEVGLTEEERRTVRQLLEKDNTDQKLSQSVESLSKQQKERAAAEAGEALESASRNLGQALQTLQAARARDMEQARKQLTEADGQLQEAKKQNAEGKNPQESLSQAGESLGKSPRISKEFNDALAKAKQGQKDASDKARSGKEPGGTEKSIEQAQDGVVQALEALQDEQAAEQESKREGEGRQNRSAMDYLSSQGSVDIGWRKNILDEMARLRASGEPSNSPILQYLESRLR